MSNQVCVALVLLITGVVYARPDAQQNVGDVEWDVLDKMVGVIQSNIAKKNLPSLVASVKGLLDEATKAQKRGGATSGGGKERGDF